MSTTTAPEITETKRRRQRTILVGFDLGTNTSSIKTVDKNDPQNVASHLVPTVVGYVRDGIVDGIIPGDASVLFGQDALRHRMHLDLVSPLKLGVIGDEPSARVFCQFARDLMGLHANDEVRAVIGIPARTDEVGREKVRRAVKGVFDKTILIPEPFLAALGARDESRLGQADYVDPVSNSLFIDIGAGSTDLCLVQGYYPLPEDQMGVGIAGDSLDAEITEGLRQKYPELDLSLAKVRQLKEAHAYVGPSRGPVMVKLLIAGKPREIEISTVIHQAAENLLNRIFECVCHLVAMAESDSIQDLLRNIVVTGGGCLIRNFGPELQRRLAEEGFENPQVHILGENYKEFVAQGALKAALAAREDQWQTML